MKYRVIVTGGSGLVGKAIESIAKEYEDYDFIFLSSKDINLLNYESTYFAFDRYMKYDKYGNSNTMIIHLAACVGGLFKNLNHNVEMFEGNILMNMNLLNAANVLNVQRVVSILSTCIFPDQVTYPINEDMLHNGAPHNSNMGYAYAKRMLEVQSQLYQRQYNRDYICVIPTNIYGEYDNFHLEDSHVIPGLIHKCYLQKMKGEPFVVMGSGKPLRQFIYSKDLAKLIVWVLMEYKSRENIILSVSEKDEVSIKEVAEIIAEKMNYKDKLVFDESKSDGQYKKSVSNDKIMELLPEFKFTGIEEGLDKTIKWFLENYPNVRK
jgi:GDP-L-fucose synthase